MKFAYLAILLMASALAVSSEVLENYVSAEIGKPASCTMEENQFECIIQANENIDIVCSSTKCNASVMGESLEIEKSQLQQALSFPALACIYLGTQGVEGCSCQKTDTGLKCNVQKVRTSGFCSNNDCTLVSSFGELQFTVDENVAKSTSQNYLPEPYPAPKGALPCLAGLIIPAAAYMRMKK